MRVAIAILISFLCCRMQAQDAAWARVERLPHGARVVLTTYRHNSCIVQSVNDDGMECLYRGAVWWVDRESIRLIELPKAKGSILGMVIGGAALGTVAAVKGDSDDALIGVGASVALGGYVGYAIGHAVDRGRVTVIYQSP